MYSEVAKHNKSVNSNIDKQLCPADCRAETENERIETENGKKQRMADRNRVWIEMEN